MQEGSTTGDAKLMDIRTGADRTVYVSAGEAVRGQIGKLKSVFDELGTRKLTYQNPFNQFPDADISELKTASTEGFAYSPTGTLVSDFYSGVNGVSLPSAGNLGFLLSVDFIGDGDYVFSVRRSTSTIGRCTLQYLNEELGSYENVSLDAISGTAPEWTTTINITAKKAQYSGLKYLRVLFSNTGSEASVYYMPMMFAVLSKYRAFFINTSSPLSGKKSLLMVIQSHMGRDFFLVVLPN